MAKPEKTELVDLLRQCGAGDVELCERCPYSEHKDCSGDLLLDAADALAAELGMERL